MLDPQGAFFIRDHQLVSASEETKIPAESLLIYEVVRIVDAACLFCQEHFNRLKFSSKLAGIQLNISEEEFQSDLQQLIEANNCKEGNVKILLQYHKGTQVVYFILSRTVIPHWMSINMRKCRLLESRTFGASGEDSSGKPSKSG